MQSKFYLYIFLFLPSLLFSSYSLLQSTWLPVSYNASDFLSVKNTVDNLADHGVQRIYLAVWNQGTVYFSSSTMKNLMGKNSTSNGNDLLGWTLEAANARGIEVVAWFEYGLMTQYATVTNDFAAVATEKGWVLGLYNNFYWMDPRNEDVTNFLLGIMTDAIKGYSEKGLRGIQLDDHFACPIALEGCSASVMTSAMQIMRGGVRATNENTIFSLSPSTLSLSNGTYCVDWNEWGKEELYDEVIPQLYRSDFASYQSIMDETLATISNSTSQRFIAAGIRADGSGSPTGESDLLQMIQYSLLKGVGNVVWYAHGILELYPESFGSSW